MDGLLLSPLPTPLDDLLTRCACMFPTLAMKICWRVVVPVGFVELVVLPTLVPLLKVVPVIEVVVVVLDVLEEVETATDVVLPIVEPARFVDRDWKATHWPSWEMAGLELSPLGDVL
jgi:hypothetical protein